MTRCVLLPRVMYLLGYIPRDNRVYLGDKELNVVGYGLQLAVLEYQTAIMRKDFDSADKVAVGGVLGCHGDSQWLTWRLVVK